MIATDQFGLTFREIKGHAVGFGEDRGGKYKEGDAHGKEQQPLVTAALPVSFVDNSSVFVPEREEEPAVCSLVGNNVIEVEFAKKQENRNKGEPEGNFVGNHLGAGSHTTKKGVFRV